MSKCVFCFIYYNCIIILLSVTVFVCHDKGNVFCTINSPVYVYWKQVNDIFDSLKTSRVLCGRISGRALCRSSYWHGTALLITPSNN